MSFAVSGLVHTLLLSVPFLVRAQCSTVPFISLHIFLGAQRVISDFSLVLWLLSQAALIPSTCKGRNSPGPHKASDASILVKRACGVGLSLIDQLPGKPNEVSVPVSPAVWLLQMFPSC